MRCRRQHGHDSCNARACNNKRKSGGKVELQSAGRVRWRPISDNEWQIICVLCNPPPPTPHARMPPPQAIICEICGGKFSKHSLLIHQKQCAVKREASTSFCPVCDCLVSNDEYSSHVGECKRVQGTEKADAKRAVATKLKKAAGKAGKGGGAAAPPTGEGLAVVGNLKAVVQDAVAAAAAPAKPQRSKIPESVLKRLAAANNGEKAVTPEQQLQRQLGVDPCLACGAPKAAVACVGCHAVYCKPCSDMLHEANKALSSHKPFVKEVSPAAHTRC